MPRRKFIQDLGLVRANPPPRVSDIESYEGDGLSFTCSMFQSGTQKDIELTVLPTDIDDYPSEHEYIIFTLDTCTDPILLTAIEQLSAKTAHMDIETTLRTICDTLDKVFQACKHGSRMNVWDGDSVICPSDEAVNDTKVKNAEDNEDHDACSEEFEDFEGDSDDGFGFNDNLQPQTIASHRNVQDKKSTPSADVRKIKSDLRAVRHAGFRVGIYGDLTASGIICLSIRVTKLGISEEAMKAWSLSRIHYLVLLIRVDQGYRTFQHILSDKFSPGSLEMRTALCETYKPSVTDAHNAFNTIEGGSQVPLSQPELQKDSSGHLEPLFIGKPLNELLRDRFVPVARFRCSIGLGWGAAEKLYHDNLGALTMRDETITQSLSGKDEDDIEGSMLPSISSADALASQPRADAVSLPLVAMQFLLRHFVRCTEFCLVCHCKLENTFDALKPYVCSKPLCLYQFLAYGFGPPAEYDIISQPYVVDLLVSLCYAQATANSLKEFPLGIGLKVSEVMTHRSTSTCGASIGSPQHSPKPTFRAKMDVQQATLEVGTDGVEHVPKFRGGEWIIVSLGPSCCRQYRVRNVVNHKLYLGDLVHPLSCDDMTIRSGMEVDCFLYNQNFDDIPEDSRCAVIEAMLQCIPSVMSMRDALRRMQKIDRQPHLRQLKGIPPAVQDLLRWIIASNRSCIMQVDRIEPGTKQPNNLDPYEPRISGMKDYIQFRFAQGAPDKEQRFVECVKKHTQNQKHPTIFAWHGSPLQNWHSIVRQGLNFDVVTHGRACGNGVYMSSQLQTSLGYARGGSTGWCNSELKITQVVSLQEVVNAPRSFVSTSPHFVVAQKDWIQTRYLFVRSQTAHSQDKHHSAVYVQDPVYIARGATGENIQIPITALPKSRRFSLESPDPTSSKRRKIGPAEQSPSEDIADDCISTASLEEDLRWLDLDTDFDTEATADQGSCTATPFPGTGRKHALGDTKYVLVREKTDFIPNTLDVSGIKFLPPPSDASSPATMALMKAFQATIKIQESTPLHELGFYIDADRVDNMYQWIVELHSFDPSLPLAADMKRAGINSVVLEMRFTNQFPFTPPFARIVKPRFLPFFQGGGGHVTEGGAICMELLTSSGWSAVNSIESVLLQIRLELSDTVRPARLQTGSGGRPKNAKHDSEADCYHFGEAVSAFKRACQRHKWEEPEGFDSLLLQGS